MDVLNALKEYSFILDQVKELQIELDKYIELKKESEITLKAQKLTGLPSGGEKINKTEAAVEAIVDKYDKKINQLTEQINILLDNKFRLDQAIERLTPEEKRVILMRYVQLFRIDKIRFILKFESRTAVHNLINAAIENINKSINKKKMVKNGQKLT